MFNGKMKAVTFSYDDGVLQDERLIRIFNKYGLKGTFNLNSDLLGKTGELGVKGVLVNHSKVNSCDVKKIYDGHEVAVHTLTHPNLTTLDEVEIVRQVENDRKKLGELVGYEVNGMAYPCGGINNDDRVADVIKKATGVKYSRTITSTHSFDIQNNLYRFNPTLHHGEKETLYDLVKLFIDLKTDAPALLYIWGHSYEFDADNSWDDFENICKDLSGRDDVFYGTNREVLL